MWVLMARTAARVGDDGPAVKELDEHTLAMPDWRGNNRLDFLRNIVIDGRV